MGNGTSTPSDKIPEPHLRIYKNIIQIQSPSTRVQMLETLFAGQEYVTTAKQLGVYGPILSYIVSVRRGDPAFLPGEKPGSHQQQLQIPGQPYTAQPNGSGVQHGGHSTGQGSQQQHNGSNSVRGKQSDNVVVARGDQGVHNKAITFFSQCLQILELSEEVALNEKILKDAYKKASIRCHPDKGGSEEAFDSVTRAYAYLGDILRRVRGGRSEMVNVSEESPARLAAAREDKSESWKLNEPVKLNPKSLNIDVFNRAFEETRMPDPDGDGYGDWLKSSDGSQGGTSNKFNGKFNRSVFNDAFESEISSRANQNNSQISNRQPEALVMAPTFGIELGRDRPEDFTGANLNGLKYTDLKKAYTTDSTFSHQVAGVRVSNRSFDSAATERKTAPAPLSYEELEAIAEGERRMAQRQMQQSIRITEEDRKISEHFKMMQRYVIRDK